jgi:hypothetical protein
MHLLLLLFFLFPSFLLARLNHDRDFQFWVREYKKKKFNEYFAMALDSEWRFGNDASELFYIHEQISTIFYFSKWLTVAPCYRQVWRKNPVKGRKHMKLSH